MHRRNISSRMGVIDDNARRRLREWLEASRGRITQDELASALGKKQNYVSRYLDGTIYRIELDTLATMAGVFGRTLCELLDSLPDGKEGNLIENFRAMGSESREALLTMARALGGIREKAP